MLLGQRVIWVTWERQLRNQSMTNGLGVPLFMIQSRRSRALRYLTSAMRTFRLLLHERPRVVVAQNPSMVLCLWLLLLKPLMRFKLAVDAHYGGVVSANSSRVVQGILDTINRSVDLVIVTNESQSAYVMALGGKPFICPDPLPDLEKHRSGESTVDKKVFFVCSFDKDEPYREVLLAASMLSQEGFRFFVSGNYRRAGIDPDEFPNVRFLGFVPESEYYQQLFSSDVVADLTDFDNCLVCGAYEAMAAFKPTVLSRKPALQQYFTGGTVFTDNRAPEIAQAVREAYAGRDSLREAGHRWVEEANAQMTERLSSLRRTLEGL